MPISESFGIPYKAMHRCSHGGSYTVEQHRFCTACTMQKHWPSDDNSVPLLLASRSSEPAGPQFDSLLRACLFTGSDSLPARACAYNRMTRGLPIYKCGHGTHRSHLMQPLALHESGGSRKADGVA